MPTTLTLGALSAGLAGLSALAAAAVIYTVGDSLLTGMFNSRIGITLSVDAVKALSSGTTDDPFRIMRSRAAYWLGVAVAQLILAACLRSGCTGMRILFPIFSLGAAMLRAYDLSDGSVPVLLRLVDGLGLVFTIAAIVLVWLSPAYGHTRVRSPGAQ